MATGETGLCACTHLPTRWLLTLGSSETVFLVPPNLGDKTEHSDENLNVCWLFSHEKMLNTIYATIKIIVLVTYVIDRMYYICLIFCIKLDLDKYHLVTVYNIYFLIYWWIEFLDFWFYRTKDQFQGLAQGRQALSLNHILIPKLADFYINMHKKYWFVFFLCNVLPANCIKMTLDF